MNILQDKYGRRKPMMWGSFGLGISMMLISILLSFQSRGGDLAKATSSASVTFFFTYMLIFGATANCIPWVYVPEILRETPLLFLEPPVTVTRLSFSATF